MSLCIECTLHRKYESWKAYPVTQTLKCMMCRETVVQKVIVVETDGIFNETSLRAFKALNGNEQANRKCDTAYMPRAFFDRVISQMGTVFKTSNTVRGGLCTWVRVTDQNQLNCLFSFHQLFPKQGFGSFRVLPTGEIAGWTPPVIFKHTTTQQNIQRCHMTGQIIVFNSKGRIKFASDAVLSAREWGKPLDFRPESYVRAVFSKLPLQLEKLGCKVHPAIFRKCAEFDITNFELDYNADVSRIGDAMEELSQAGPKTVEFKRRRAEEEREVQRCRLGARSFCRLPACHCVSGPPFFIRAGLSAGHLLLYLGP